MYWVVVGYIVRRLCWGEKEGGVQQLPCSPGGILALSPPRVGRKVMHIHLPSSLRAAPPPACLASRGDGEEALWRFFESSARRVRTCAPLTSPTPNPKSITLPAGPRGPTSLMETWSISPSNASIYIFLFLCVWSRLPQGTQPCIVAAPPPPPQHILLYCSVVAIDNIIRMIIINRIVVALASGHFDYGT